MALTVPRSTGELLGAESAAARLGVRKATLYAYVSRGLLTAVPDAADPRCSRYSAFEIDRLLQATRERRHRPTQAQAQKTAEPTPSARTLYEGRALIDTELTGLVAGQIVIRGHPLVAWSREASLEDTAALLWGVPLAQAFGGPVPPLPPLWHRTAAELRGTDPVSRMVVLWGLAMPELHGGAGLSGTALAASLGQHLRVAFACALAQPPDLAPLHRQVARAWRLPTRHHDSLRQALVLCADIMLNLTGLSGRMIASVQGSLAACLLATMGYGFIRLSGGEFEAVEALFDEILAVGDAPAVAASYRARGEAMPGFHHPLFPQGDPRAAALVQGATALGSPAAAWVQAMQQAHPLTPLHPTLDYGLVALRRAWGAPRHAALAITQMARCTGALAQALEQRGVGQRMWVQSRYVGPAAAPDSANPAPFKA